MDGVDLYQAVGGRDVCRQLSEAFYTRVQRDAVLRPLFPGKSIRCAVNAFAAFLAQFLGGPADDAEERWWLSLRDSHLRFEIGPRERRAWMRNMAEALEEAPLDDGVRVALRNFFERSSAYVAGEAEASESAPEDGVECELAQRWTEQRRLDDLVTAIRAGDAGRALALTEVLQDRLARDRAVFAHVLGLMTASDAFVEYVERTLLADAGLGQVRNRYGRSLLHDASACGSVRVVELLLRLGADANVSCGRTPLYCVANECGVAGGGDVVRALVRAGADVDAPSGSKRCTALHMAARRGNVEVAEALLDCEAEVNVRDAAGDTPLRRAQKCRKAGVALLLRARGGVV
jgi:hemoglobin